MSALAGIAFPLRLSVQVAGVATLLSAAVGLPLAYLLATREFRGKGLLDVAVTLPLVLPPIVTGYYLLLLIGRNGVLGRVAAVLGATPPQVTFTWVAAALAAFVVSLPLTVRTARAAFESVDPALMDTSRTLGHGEAVTALRVVLPLAARGVLAGLVLSFARALGEFGATVMVAGNIPGRTNTMPLEIYSAMLAGDRSTATALVLIFTCASAVFLFAAGRLSRAVAP